MSALLIIMSVLTSGPDAPMLAGSEAHHRGLLIAQAAPPPLPPADLPLPPPESGRYDNWSKAQLQLELTRLENLKPSLGLPIVLLSAGGFVALVGLYVASTYLIAGLFILIPGVAVLVWGAILLAQRIPERRILGEQINDIQFRLDHFDHPFGVPPPPPPSVRAPTPTVLLAQF